MAFKDFIHNIFSANKKAVPSNIQQYKRKARLSQRVESMPNYRIKMDIRNVVNAAENAVDPLNPDRSDLLSIYERTVKDSQYICEHDKAESFLITEPFDVMLKGQDKADEQRTDLFRRPWFTDFLTMCLEAEFWGYTLLEFGLQDEHGEFMGIKIFPRHHVRPFEREITKHPDDIHGLPYGDRATEYFLLPVGQPEDIGKLETIAVEVIWKTFARSDWSEYNERFGKPMVIYKTSTNSDSELDEAFEMAQKFGSDLAGVCNPEDELDVKPVASTESAENYDKLALRCDEYISKLMNGQTGTSDVKAWTGTAEVHERVLTEFTKARLKRIEDFINYNLFPFLIAHGYQLEGYEFSFYALRSKPENTVDNKSLDEKNLAKKNQNKGQQATDFFD